MLYGNLFFIKKTGGDGSKYPVKEKNIKIGRSDKCLIRIYNPQVALEHCELVIDDHGQAKLKILSNSTILNGKLLSQGSVTLCHGDIFKIGERLVRWEYLPSSNYYKQLLSPSGRLVAVVMPQQRSLEGQMSSGTSSPQTSFLKHTPLGGKNRYSERFNSGSSSSKKISKSNSTNKAHKNMTNTAKFLSGRRSLQGSKMLFSPKVKQRKSLSGIMGSKTPKAVQKSRKSTWKVNVLSPESDKKSNQRSSPLQNKGQLPTKVSEKLLNSARKSTVKTPSLKTIAESSPRETEESVRSSRSSSTSPTKLSVSGVFPSALLSTPQKNVSPKPVRLINSEKKMNSNSKSRGGSLKGGKRLSLNFKPNSKTPNKAALKKIHTNLSKTASSPEVTIRTSRNRLIGVLDAKNETPKKQKIVETDLISIGHSSKRTPPSPTKSVSVKKSPEKKTGSVKNSPESVKRSPGKKTTACLKKLPGNETPAFVKRKSIKETPESGKGTSAKKTPASNKRKSSKATTAAAKRTSTLETSESVIEASASSDRSPIVKESPKKSKKTPEKHLTPKLKVETKTDDEKTSSTKQPPNNKKLNSSRSSTSQGFAVESPSSAKKRGSPRKSLSEIKSTPSKGVRRTLSPSISSAERAAKKLKTSSPRKPDKNKKAALLVLGIASRKQQLSQNVKVLLKQKIVKKAIKQSTVPSICKNDKASNKKDKKGSKKVLVKGKKKSVVKNLKTSKSKDLHKAISASTSGSLITLVELTEEEKLKGKRSSEADTINRSKVDSPASQSSLKFVTTTDEAVPVKQSVSHSFRMSIASKHSSNNPEESSPASMLLDSYTFSTNRRCSKRLSSKNDESRPDFMELSPTALGLMPKHVETCETLKEIKRRSSSLTTPKNVRTGGIIKSASTSKIGNRKSVRFSSKEISINSPVYTPNTTQGNEFDFDSLKTPNITVDLFVSPLSEKKSAAKSDFNTSARVLTFASEDYAKNDIGSKKSPTETVKSARKLLQFPQTQSTPKIALKKKGRSSKASGSSKKEKISRQSISVKKHVSPKKDSSVIKGGRQLFVSLQKMPTNEMEDYSRVHIRCPKIVEGQKKELNEIAQMKTQLVKTPLINKSPKNDLTNATGVKKLMKTPLEKKSPQNDLTDVQGVKGLLRTPKEQKSPKNDLSDVRGVKRIMKTPREQKSPKNDLSDVRGVKRIMKTPREQKSPKNDLTDVAGVKRLMKTPREQKSPKNDLTDVRGVKRLMRSPRETKSPKNDLTDVAGVKQLMKTPHEKKSPKNDLTDVRGVKRLMKTPREQKSPKNELSDLRGVRQLLGSPKVQKGPKNDLTDLTGVRELMTTPQPQQSSKDDSIEVMRLDEFFSSPKSSKTPKNDDKKAQVVKSPESSRSVKNCSINVPGVEQILISKTPSNFMKGKKSKFEKSHIRDFKSIRGRRTIYSTPKGPKNDLSDVTGVRELFSRHKPINDLNISFTGVAELFDFPLKSVKKQLGRKSSGESSVAVEVKTEAKNIERKKTRGVVSKDKVVEEISIRGTRSRKALPWTVKKSVRKAKEKSEEEVKEQKKERKTGGTSKRKSEVTTSARKVVKEPPKKVATLRGRSTKVEKVKAEVVSEDNTAKTTSRKRKIIAEVSEPSPPKLRRRQPATEEPASKKMKKGTPKKALSAKREVAPKTEKKIPVANKVSTKDTKKSEKPSSKAKSTQVTTKTSAKTTSQVQKNRSQTVKQSESDVKVSPRKTRSGKTKTASQEKKTKVQRKTVGMQILKKAVGKKKASPVVKRSTRRK